MVCVVPSLSMTPLILTRLSMMLTMVRPASFFEFLETDKEVLIESTVITLADWYHTLARQIVGVA